MDGAMGGETIDNGANSDHGAQGADGGAVWNVLEGIGEGPPEGILDDMALTRVEETPLRPFLWEWIGHTPSHQVSWLEVILKLYMEEKCWKLNGETPCIFSYEAPNSSDSLLLSPVGSLVPKSLIMSELTSFSLQPFASDP
uniref:Uncharacterized protein n=1 Tax=Sphaerodactylus townsendi TaxID=933632 RepID=A0ACB8FTJ5_9SAUR